MNANADAGTEGNQGAIQPFKPYHQLATFAPSKNDILSTLEFFFGKPAQPEKLNDFSEHHAATYHFPDAYVGKNVYLRDTLNNLILSSPQDWQTNAALPWLKIEGVTVAWDEIHFDVRLLQRVPYEGASRMQTSMRRSHRDRVVRRGIALIIESDFYRTEAGRKYFSDQMTSVRYCVQETANFDVLFAYLTCHNYDHHWDVSKNLLPHRNIISAMKHELVSFAAVQKSGQGLDLAIEKAKQRLARYHIEPNMLIMAPETQLYVTMIPPEKTVFAERGERGPASFDAYRGNKAWASFRGLNVFTSNPFDSGDNVDSLQMLRRSTQVGEFYQMRPPSVVPSGGLPPTYMDMLIYDEQKDRHAHITLRAAMEHAMPWMLFATDNTSGIPTTQDPLGIKVENNEEKLDKSYNNTMDRVKDDAQAKARLTKAYFKLSEFNYKREHFRFLVDLAEEGVWVPLNIVVARPFIEHHMLSAILTISGADTGNTLFGPADMQISANTTVKTIEGHYTCHTKAVITKPQNVLVMRDIQCDGYVAGSDVVWFGDLSKKEETGSELTPTHIANDIRERLDFEHEHDNQYASMLAFICPFQESEQHMQDMAFSLTSANLPWDIGSGGNDRNFPGGKKFWDQYRTLFGLDFISAGTDPASVQNRDFVRNGSYNNAICLLGPHRVYTPFGDGSFELVSGQGHFGQDARPGDVRWRRGEAINIKEARGALSGMEAITESQKLLHRR